MEPLTTEIALDRLLASSQPHQAAGAAGAAREAGLRTRAGALCRSHLLLAGLRLELDTDDLLAAHTDRLRLRPQGTDLTSRAVDGGVGLVHNAKKAPVIFR